MRKLTGKQLAFVIAYLTNGYNGTKAAKTAGYKGNDVTLAAVAYENLRKPHIQQKIATYFEEKSMPADEVLFRLGEQARLDIGDFIKVPEEGGWKLDLEAVKEKGRLVKRIKETLTGPEILLHDSQKALQLVGKNLGLFKDKVEHEGKLWVTFNPPIPEEAMERDKKKP